MNWQQMETAPRDGRELILAVESRAGIRGRCLVGHYIPGGFCIEDHPPIEEGWYFWNGLYFDQAAQPVAWMPLPPVPTFDGTTGQLLLPIQPQIKTTNCT